MLRGAQKQMIVIRTHNSRLFEEAYFVVRRPRTGQTPCKADMLWEANRIIEHSMAAATEPTGGVATLTDASAGESAPVAGSVGSPEPRARFRSRRRLWLSRGFWFALGALGGFAVAVLFI